MESVNAYHDTDDDDVTCFITKYLQCAYQNIAWCNLCFVHCEKDLTAEDGSEQ